MRSTDNAVPRSRQHVHNSIVEVFQSIVIAVLCSFLIFCPFLLVSADTKTEIVHPLLRVLRRAKVSGSVEINGQCDAGNLPELPIANDIASDGEILDILRKQFIHDPAMRITQDRDGMIRMRESEVPDDILRIRIGNFEFDGHSPDGGIYAPNVAVLRVMVTPELVEFRKSRNVEWRSPFFVAPSNLGAPSPRLPHVSGSLQNVTVAQIFDHVLTTFPGIWVYQNCPAHGKESRVVVVRFFSFEKPN